MDQIEEVRSKIDIVQLLSEYLPLKKAGRNFKANCPFHSEKAPSFVVSPERQIWKCFGCGKGGSVFNFIMEIERVEFGEALRILAKKAGVTLVSYKSNDRELAKDVLLKINHLASEFYHYLLLSHPVGKRALEYILGRGITVESLKLFKIGYAPAVWGGLQKYLVGKKGYQVEDLFRAGLVSRRNSSYNDFFHDRLIFPLQDNRGNFVGFAGRFIGKWEEGQSYGPKYMNTPETDVYQKGNLLYGLNITKEAIRKQNKAVIVEGELDLISSFQAGVTNTVAIKGSALTEAQVKLLKRFCENICLALDMDLAGDMAAKRGIEVADAEGLNIRVVRLPEGKDPDELARKDPEMLKKVVNEAIPIYDFYLESAFARHDSQTPEGKRKIGEEILPVLDKIADDIIKSHYLRQLSGLLGVSEESIKSQMEKTKTKSLSPQRAVLNSLSKPAVKKTRGEILEEYFFTLALQGKKEEVLIKAVADDLIGQSVLRKIGQLIAGSLKENKKFESRVFLDNLPPELHEIFNNFYLLDMGDKMEDNDWLEKELGKTVVELKKETFQEKLKLLSSEMTVLEQKGDSEEVKKLEVQFKKISQELTDLLAKQSEPHV